MVTFLVCLVVVGGAMAAILMVTMDGAIDQPATHRTRHHRRHRLQALSSRVSTYLVPTGGSAAPPRPAARRPAARRPAAPGGDEAPVPGAATSFGTATATVPVRTPATEAQPTTVRPAAALQERPRPRPDVGRTGLVWESSAGSPNAARQSPARRALRRMRGAVALVFLLVLLGTVLALALAGFGALVAVGVRAAVGT
ncbi:MAG: hypothetical protein WD232_01035 [Acidimicrobiales bacterium]